MHEFWCCCQAELASLNTITAHDLDPHTPDDANDLDSEVLVEAGLSEVIQARNDTVDPRVRLSQYDQTAGGFLFMGEVVRVESN